MKKPKEVWIVFICVVLFMFTASFLSVYGESIIDIIAAKQQSDMKKERLRTYGLSKTEWGYLNREGITFEDAQKMERLYDRSEVSSLLSDAAHKIMESTYTEEDNPVEKYREELKLWNSTVDVIVANKYKHINGLWEANRSFVERERFYVQININEEGSESLEMILYRNDPSRPVTPCKMELEFAWDDSFSMRDLDTGDVVTITEVNEDTLSMQIGHTFYDLTRGTESGLDEYMEEISKLMDRYR